MPSRILHHWQLLAVAVTVLVVPAAAPAADRARYDEILEMIDDNLHFTAHLTWAVTAKTIAVLRDQVSTSDIPVLVEMLADEDVTAHVTAGALLATMGEAARPALEAAAASPNWQVEAEARQALQRIEDCRTSPEVMNPDVCPRRP